MVVAAAIVGELVTTAPTPAVFVGATTDSSTETSSDLDDHPNQSIADNNLGMLSHACASFCHTGLDGLDLWMSFRDVSDRRESGE